MKKITIKADAAAFDELAACEMGSHEDRESIAEEMGVPHDVDDCCHCLVESRRFKSVMHLVGQKQIDTIYYGIATGTFSMMDPEATGNSGRYRVACRLADEMREHVTPELAKSYPSGM